MIHAACAYCATLFWRVVDSVSDWAVALVRDDTDAGTPGSELPHRSERGGPRA